MQHPREDELKATLFGLANLLAARRGAFSEDRPTACRKHPLEQITSRRMDGLSPKAVCREIAAIVVPIFRSR